MNECKYIRRGASIVEVETNKEHTYDSINEAKRRSRKLQLDADGALGRGTLRVKEVKRKAKRKQHVRVKR